MAFLKKAWINERTKDLYTLTLESKREDDLGRLHVDSTSYPENPSPEHPLRHVSVIRFLDAEDLVELHNTLSEWLYG